MLKSLIFEYGIKWAINRALYSAKLKMMKIAPITEKLFEKDIRIKRIDIFDIQVDKIKEFLDKLPEYKKVDILKVADYAIKGKIYAFSSIFLDYGEPINWHYNPITQIEVSKFLKWYEIEDFDSVRGDIKVIWEASRFTHFYYFTRAYIITNDDKYYKAFSDQLNSWIQDNPYSYGSNFKCGQEATFRMINALISYSVFNAYGVTSQRDRENIFKLIESSYKKVISNFFYAHKCIRNNHTISELVGLIIGAWCAENNKKLKKAYALLDKEIMYQFLDDGGYIQYSFNYQRLVFQLLEVIFKIANKTKNNISKDSRKRIINSILLMYQMQDITGDLPNYGSNDGALIFPVTICGYRDFRPVINTIYALITGNRLFDNGDYDEELLWFGNNSINEYPIQKVNRVSSSFSKSGFYSFRHNSGFLMIILNNFKTRPAQFDQLHIDVWHNGINILCDSGTYSYADERGRQLALTSAHNTIKFDTKEQMKKHGHFYIYDWTKIRHVEYRNGSFTGTLISRNGYTHNRYIKLLPNGYLIEDTITSNGDGSICELVLHTPCEVKLVEDGCLLVNSKNNIVAKIKIQGILNIQRAYRSLYYLTEDEITQVSLIKKLVDNKCKFSFEIELY